MKAGEAGKASIELSSTCIRTYSYLNLIRIHKYGDPQPTLQFLIE